MKFENLMMVAAASTTIFSGGGAGADAGPARRVDHARPVIYAYESDAGGFNTKNYFYDNGEEVVVVDTQFTPELARKSIEALRLKTSNPITYVVITHPNPDKFNGMAVFQKLGAKVIASVRTAQSLPEVQNYKKNFFVNVAKMFTEETYPALSKVDITFEGRFDLKLGNGDVVNLRELSSPGVSSDQTIALIPRIHAAVVGDLVHHNAHAWLEGGIVKGKPVPTLKGWIADLSELQSLLRSAPGTLIYGGRGETVPVGRAVADQIAYLRKADALVTKYVAGLGKRKSELLGPQAGDHYKALQALFEREFPGYGLGYMIQYGVYGLVNSKL